MDKHTNKLQLFICHWKKRERKIKGKFLLSINNNKELDNTCHISQLFEIEWENIILRVTCYCGDRQGQVGGAGVQFWWEAQKAWKNKLSALKTGYRIYGYCIL